MDGMLWRVGPQVDIAWAESQYGTEISSALRAWTASRPTVCRLAETETGQNTVH
jgi:hypothetical protein